MKTPKPKPKPKQLTLADGPFRKDPQIQAELIEFLAQVIADRAVRTYRGKHGKR